MDMSGSNMGKAMAQIIANTVNGRVTDGTTKHIGYVGKQPVVGEKMVVIQFEFERVADAPTKANFRPIRRESTPVVKAIPVDGLRLWDVLTMSGRQYRVEVMF